MSTPGLDDSTVFLWVNEKRSGRRVKRSRRRILGPHAHELLRKNFSRRQLDTGLQGWNKDWANAPRWNGIRPAVVITTTPAGIRACKILAEETEFGAVFEYSCYLTEYEYRYWCKEEPDPNLQFHVNYWAWIKTSVPSTRMHEFRNYPLPEDNQYWLLRHGLNGLGKDDYADCQVFGWDGTTTRLLAEHFREGVPSV